MEVVHEHISTRYRIFNRLGVGTMGMVYHVFDRLMAQHLALKVVSSTPVDSSLVDTALDFRLALAHEFQLLASLRHPNIISVLDYGFDRQGRPYYTMELLRDHQTILKAGQGLSIPRKVRLVVQMLQALLYLHRRGILHRDLKPANALVAHDRLRILDFGLAQDNRHSKETDVISGTPAYIAPEILTGVPPSTASDLYAVGVILFELLTGRHPFDTSNLEQLIFDIMNTAPNLNVLVTQLNLSKQTLDYSMPPIAGDDLILQIVHRLLEKTPEKRYQDAADVIHDLSRAIGERLPVETTETRESFLQASNFVGREAELKALTQVLDALSQNRGCLTLIHGESGVGKSRLMNEFRAQAMVKGALVVRGQAGDQALPYQIWREPLRRLILEVDLDEADISTLRVIVQDIDRILGRTVSLASDDKQGDLYETIIGVLKKVQQPLVILLDDLHLAKSESFILLQKIVEVLPSLPIMIVGNYRDDDSRVDFDRWFPNAKTIKLRRLDRAAIESLTVAMFGTKGKRLVDYIQRETEGNAFFLTEVMRALAEEFGQLELVNEMDELPDSIFTGGVQRIVERRLNRVPRIHYPLLQIAAALGRQIDLKVLQAAAPEADLQEWLLALSDAAVLEFQDNEWQFAHEKIRDGVNITLNYEQLNELYKKANHALERVYHPSVAS